MYKGGGIAISGLPADLAEYNATYVPTGRLIQGFPSFFAGPKRHLFRHPADDEWRLTYDPCDPAETACVAHIPAAGGPVPTGARAWMVAVDDEWVTAELTAREVA